VTYIPSGSLAVYSSDTHWRDPVPVTLWNAISSPRLTITGLGSACGMESKTQRKLTLVGRARGVPAAGSARDLRVSCGIALLRRRIGDDPGVDVQLPHSVVLERHRLCTFVKCHDSQPAEHRRGWWAQASLPRANGHGQPHVIRPRRALGIPRITHVEVRRLLGSLDGELIGVLRVVRLLRLGRDVETPRPGTG